ncbi:MULTISPECIES: 6-carboxytetrahydropterin synthase [Natrinema]|uniref:6-carboxytetrahydropterin synthase n=2 Tax=Natrinema TaxID=88723 RepID=A0A482Y4L5_9EURY|nr:MULTISPECIES: 6-carboxytetrahydropterin synthase [Natrinema]AFO55885.1 6-pyruvoyltetrahydropterin synthase [Natrinema sp. J7-2]ELY79537.1 6-pyruvoyltetrahydropterin synthase [Natrinema gari JCM 14663]RZH68736.1 6-carboxytetrahydropterin synthase [Natrinema altunense]
MYTVTVTRDFVAQHWLTVPDPGPEGALHSHHLTVEVEVEGERLGEYGYLVDIDDLKAVVDALVDRYRDATLNDLPEFEGRNPSVEHFSRCFAERVADGIETDRLDAVAVTTWEEDAAAASYAASV